MILLDLRTRVPKYSSDISDSSKYPIQSTMTMVLSGTVYHDDGAIRYSLQSTMTMVLSATVYHDDDASRYEFPDVFVHHSHLIRKKIGSDNMYTDRRCAFLRRATKSQR